MASKPAFQKKDGDKDKEDLVEELEALRGHCSRLKAVVERYEHADEELSRLASIVTSSDDAIIGKTLDGIITSWNKSAERLYGYSEAEAVGKHIRIIVPPDHMPELNEILDRIRRGERVDHHETVRATKDGRRIDVSITISPIVDAAGNVIGASTIARDITERKRAEEALKLTQFAIDNFNDSSIWLSPEGRLVYVNEMTLNWLGYSREELLSMFIWDIDPDYTPERFHYIWQELRQKGTVKFESTHRRRNGSVFPVEVRASLIKYGNNEYFISFDRDITEHKRAEEALLESEEKFRALEDMERQRLFSLLDGLPAFVYLQARDYSIRFANREFRKTFGEPENRPCYETIQCNDKPCSDCQTFKVFDTQQPQVWEWTTKNGNTYQIYDYPFRDIDGTPLVLEMGMDITERKRAEEALKLTQASVDRAADGIFWITREGMVSYANEAICKSLQYSQDELRGMCVWDFDPLFPRERWENHWQEIKERGSFTFESRHRAKDGSEHPVLISVNYLRSGGREFNVAFIKDITERKKAEEALRESEEKFHALADNLPVMAWMANADGGIFWYNKQCYDYTGTTLEEMQGWGWQKALHPDYVKAVTDEWSTSIKEGKPFYNTFPMRGKDGNYYWFLSRVTPIKDKNGKIQRWFGTNTDITERKRAEEELRASEEKFRVLADTSFDTIMVHRGDNLLYVNNPAVGLTGYSKDEILKMRFWELFTEDVRETIKKRAFDRLAGKSVPTSYETTILSKDGQTKWINMTAGIFLFEGKPTIIATLFDITGIKNTEKELKEAKTQAELYLDLMGHDIRNMNQVSMGFLEFALESPNIDKKDKELLLKTMGGLENSTRLIDNVSKLQKSQKGELKLHAVDACQAILRVLGHYSNIPGVDATFNYELPPGCTVMANDLLYEIFENLVGNAIKHAGPRPTISIKYETAMLNGKDYNRFIVEDNGSGIPDDLKPNIFTRRLRSGAKTRGSGLGLFIVKSLVESYDGLVWVEDRVPGDYSKGARFVVMLPAIEG